MSERERDESTERDERDPGGEDDWPVPPDSEDVALEGIDELDSDIDPEIAEEVRLLGETEEADEYEVAGPIEAAIEEAEEDEAG